MMDGMMDGDGWGFGLGCRDFFGEMFTHVMATE